MSSGSDYRKNDGKNISVTVQIADSLHSCFLTGNCEIFLQAFLLKFRNTNLIDTAPSGCYIPGKMILHGIVKFTGNQQNFQLAVNEQFSLRITGCLVLFFLLPVTGNLDTSYICGCESVCAGSRACMCVLSVLTFYCENSSSYQAYIIQRGFVNLASGSDFRKNYGKKISVTGQIADR